MAEIRHIAHCFSPINVLAAAAAIEHLHPGAAGIARLLVYHPGLPRDALDRIADFARSAAEMVPGIAAVTVLDDDEWQQIASDAQALRSQFGDGMTSISYAHDVVGNVLDTLAAAYPTATRICFGDAMGQVFERDVHLSFLRPPRARSSLLRRVWQKLSSRNAVPAAPTRPLPDRAVLMLPVDQSGNILRQVPLDVVPGPKARALFDRVAGRLGTLRSYISATVGENPANLCIFLTENWAEGGFIAFEREIDFYADVLQSLPPRIRRVLVKPHPAETRSRAAAIRERVGDRFDISDSEAEFARYPFEMWAANLPCEVSIVAMQYPALSLKYLYGISAIQPFHHGLIETYFDLSVQSSFKNALDLNMLPLARLDQWDGRSPLYCGK